MDLSKYRKDFPVFKEFNYLATGAEGPISTWVIRASQDYLAEVAREGGYNPSIVQRAREQLDESKQVFAKFVNCDFNEVASVPSVSYATNMAALMIAPKKGENIVINDLEFDSNLLPWLRYSEHGVEIRVAKSKNGILPIEEIEKHIDEKTRVVTASHISSWSGSKQDLKSLTKLAHSKGAMVVVDAINAVGAIPTNLREYEVDFFTVSAHKWLLGTKGCGFLVVNRKIIENFEPPLPGWYGVSSSKGIETVWKDVKFSSSASKFEVGTPSMVSHVAVTASMKKLMEIGLPQVYKRISDLGQYLIESLSSAGLEVLTPVERDERGAGIVFFLNPRAKGLEVHRKLVKKKIITLLMRTGDIEAYPSFFNTEEDVDSLVKVARSG